MSSFNKKFCPLYSPSVRIYSTGFYFCILLFLLLLPPLEPRPGMGQSYRSGTGSSYRSSSSSSSSYRSSSYGTKSYRSGTPDSGISFGGGESYSTTIPDSPRFDLRLKILKNGNLEVREGFQLNPDTIYKPIERVSADVLRGIMTDAPQNRPIVLRERITGENSELGYSIEKAFHPVLGNTIAYIFFEQPGNLENTSILIEQEDGLDTPEINFWLSADGGMNYLGMAPFHYFNSEQRLEIGKQYVFPKNENRYSMFFYIQYPKTVSAPAPDSLPEPTSSVSYNTKINLAKSTYSSIETDLSYRIENSSLDEYSYGFKLPTNIDYKDIFYDNGLVYYLLDRSIRLPIYYSSFHGDWETSLFSFPGSININLPEGTAKLNYETYGNFKESESRLEFDFHIPYIPLKEHRAFLKSFEIELILPEGANRNNTEILLYAARSNSLDSDPSLMELPVEIGEENGRFKIKSGESFVGPNRLVLNLVIDKSLFRINSVLHIALLIFSGLKTPFSHNFYNWFLPCLVPIFLVFTVFLIRAKKKNSIESPPTPAELTNSDPQFQIAEFQKTAGKIAYVLQNSWNRGNLSHTRAFLSAGLFSRLNTQLDLLNKIDRVTNRMDEFSVRMVRFREGSRMHGYETIHLEMDFRAKDITVPIQTGESEIQKKLKASTSTDYTEIYSFTRKISAKTNPGKTLITGNCPSCGSPADYSHYSLKCSSCGNIFNSGEKDWVLSEITQISEWESPEKKEPYPFNPQILEDRASALFWKWLKFKIYGKSIYILRDATDSFLKSSKMNPEKIYIPVVGAVNLQRVYNGDNQMEASVEIKWSSASSEDAEPTGKIAKLTLILSSKSELGFSESICANCGAPFQELDTDACEYCSTKIPEKVNDWLLESIETI